MVVTLMRDASCQVILLLVLSAALGFRIVSRTCQAEGSRECNFDGDDSIPTVIAIVKVT